MLIKRRSKIGNFVNQTAQDNKNNALSNNIHFQYIDLTSNPTILYQVSLVGLRQKIADNH